MKKIILGTLIFVPILFSTAFVFAQASNSILMIDYNTIQDPLKKIFDSSLSKDERLNLIRVVKSQLDEYGKREFGDNVVASSCQKLTQTLWTGKTDSGTNGQITLLINFLNKVINNVPCQAPAGEACDLVAVNITNTGVYNFVVSQEVKKMQKYWGINPTGNVGPKTLAKINSMICNGTPTQGSSSGNSSICQQKLANVACEAIAKLCQSGYHLIPSPKQYDSDGCVTNVCDQGQCVPNGQ